ncbi:MAG: SpoIIE family protein phosphatase [Bacteroidetes bacterium]|nr:SpoIIE family protein phosphatase [Bacteroidota bacterium]
MVFFKKSILFFFVILVSSAQAQHYNFKRFTTKNGVAHPIVQQIVQDHEGYFWLATQGGLNRFDGKKFSSFRKSNGLPTSDITAVLEDENKNIWIGTTEGLAKFDGISFTSFKNYGLNHQINSIYKDSKEIIWFCTLGGGIVSFDGKSFKQYTRKEGLITDSIFCLIQDYDKNYWIGTYHFGVSKITATSVTSGRLKCQTYTKSDGLSSNNIYCMQEDNQHTIWLGTTNGFLTKYENGKFSPFVISDETKTDFVADILKDSRNNIWVGTLEHGLIKITNKDYSFYTEAEGLSSHCINYLLEDKDKNIWICTDVGLCVFKNEAIITFNENSGLPTNMPQSIHELTDGTIVCGTAPGLSYYNGTRFISIDNIEEVKNSFITSIAEDDNGLIWLGANNGMLIVISKKGNKYALQRTVTEVNGEILSYISEIKKSNSGAIWFASYGQGLFKYHNNVYTRFSKKEGLQSDNLQSVFIDSKGNIWMGSNQNGVFKYDGNKFTNYTTANGLADNMVFGICENTNGTMFFATAEGGLSVFHNNRFVTISTKDGLSSNLILSVKADMQNNLWLGTNNGLNRLRLRSDYKVESLKIYTEQNGLEGTEFIVSNSLFIDKNGIVWAGTSNGLSKYNPAVDFANNTPPTLSLQNILLFNQKVNWQQYTEEVNKQTNLPVNLRLNYKNNHLSFEFQALSIDEDLKYTYKLEGFDKEWSPLTTSTEAVYSNIPSGRDYIFRVKALNSDGVWSTKNIEFKFYIEAPIWQRWWFIAVCILISIITVIYYINWRTSKLAKEKKQLEEKVEERTTELKHTNLRLSEAFTDIKDSINYAQRIQEAILPMDSIIKKVFPDSFILFKPRDVVSGDFYWFGTVEKNGNLYHIIAAADCTGHGVPGAFMSMIGNTILSEIVIAREIVDPSKILFELHHGIRKALKQNLTTSRDGMDICLCTINLTDNTINYAGAYNPLWVLKNNSDIEIVKANKCAIGGFTEDNQIFESHKLHLYKGDIIYLFTDGYADQFGGEYGKKMTAKKFKEAILSVANDSMEKQKFYLNNFIEIWKGKEFQVDDILVIGIKL